MISKESPIRGKKKTKAMAAGLLVLGMMSASLMLAASPAHAATTFSVNSTSDTPDAFPTSGNQCDTDVFTGGDQCTLRAAIQQANATPGADLIRFSIPGTGVQTINVGSSGLGALPTVTDPVTIDGYTQPGSSPNTKAVGNDAVLKIELSGASAPNADGLRITHVSGSSVIKGLAINRFGEGITISGDTVGNRIEGNYIGTDPTGTIDRGNTDDGVNILNGASENVVGGTTPAARNVISGNTFNAVLVNRATGNRIEGNYIGTNKAGAKGLANGDGGGAAVLLRDSSGNTVGGTTAGARNVISGNGAEGFFIDPESDDNKVLGNRIGTAANGTGALGNGDDGVFVQGSGNLVGDGTSAGSNTVAFNGDDGVEVQDVSGTSGNAISRNSIFSNAGIGIDLHGGSEDAQGNTANDPGDVDEGPNGLQNKPVLSSAKTVSGKTTITGKLNAAQEVSYEVQFYSNPSGNEGKKFIGQKFVTTDTSGNATFSFSPATAVTAGQTVTATATAHPISLGPSSGDTSEFSAPKTVASS